METHRHERWLLWCSYFKPHAPYLPPAQDWERYARLPLPVPAVDEAQLASLPAHLQRFRASTGVDRMDEAEMRRCIAGYHLPQDPEERHDLGPERPEQVARLRALL